MRPKNEKDRPQSPIIFIIPECAALVNPKNKKAGKIFPPAVSLPQNAPRGRIF